MNVDVKFSFSQTFLETKLKAAWLEANDFLGVEFTKRITENRWPWPNPPSPRDIVDLGQLRASYHRVGHSDGTRYVHTWPVSYAMAVHEGAHIKNGFGKGIAITIPGRPWISETMKEVDLEKVFATIAKRYLT